MNAEASPSPRWARAALKARARELLSKHYWPLVLVALVAMWTGDWGGAFLRVNFNFRNSPRIQEWLGRNTGLPYAGLAIPDEVASSPEWAKVSGEFVRAPNYSGFGNSSRSSSFEKGWDGSWSQTREWSLPGERHPPRRQRHALRASWSNEVWTISRYERDEDGRETRKASFSHLAPSARTQDGWTSDWPTDIVGLVVLLFVGFVALWLYVLNPLAVGVRKYFVEAHRGTARLGHLLFAFRCGHYRNVVLVALHRDLSVFLWSLLLIVPGVVKSYELRMVPFALADDPSIRWYDAFDLSKGAMNGQKADAFVLDLSFLGWWILSALTFDLLGLLFVVPYFGLALAGLYETLLRGLRLPPPPKTPCVKSTVKHLLLLLFLLVAGYLAFLGLELYRYRKADSLYERLVHESPTTKDGVDAILASCEQVPIPMSESMWGSDRVLATNENCIQYRVCGLASCPIDVVYADGTNVVHVYPSYE